jgi:glycosyltransferase involved in cell wall biosynthesis
MARASRRYAFVATGDVARNASFVRLRELGRELAGRGLDVHYFLDDEAAAASQVPPTLEFATVHLACGPSRRARLWERRRQLMKVSPAAVHILNPQPGNCGAIAGLSIPMVCDWDELLSARDRAFVQRRIDRVCEWYARRTAALHVVASRWLQERLDKDFGIDSLYLPYAAYLPPFPDGPCPFREPTAVYMGNLMPDFDHDLIIDAWEILARRGHATPQLSIIGGGPLLEAVRCDVASRGLRNVAVEGFLRGQPLWDRLRHAHVLLFPIRDTVGNRSRCPSKTFAYMQAKRPIITNRVGEVVEALGELATYVRPDPQAFADAVDQLPVAGLADVEYRLHAHQWSTRAESLLNRVEATPGIHL